ncbi:Methyltransferase domain-containing protein [Actinopolyspora xinjiangensis]|uniref:site-specific DNA-methyltransferase (adenine-specific) n=1 Tax=Actinopolyspora xinjiangensis TaxID=405564 RepID=A0A1H0VBH0_9ACTN|nr:DNA methyltransferase [Actinopolyspora xinjiangensis]SDP75585.1 Methyltransferase domain-containing protein [Actinopolyspora xinjiangensis]
MSSPSFTSVRVAGGLLPADLFGRMVEGTDLPGVDPTDYHLLPGESVRRDASRKWEYLTGVWSAFKAELDRAGENAPTTGITRERWLLVLLRELEFGRVPSTPSGGLTVGERAFPVSHSWENVPLHLLGWGVDLDRRTKGQAGAAASAPQSMVQELLNASDEHLWAVLSNGRRLRLLRDSTSLVGSAYVEFDLEAMFDGELFSDFVLLYLLVHQSRFEVRDAAVGPASCWLERWRELAEEQGSRVRERLREGVEHALETLGTGLLRHPDNRLLRSKLASGELSRMSYNHALLRLAYRMLFWFVAEDRGALLDPDADTTVRQRYQEFFSSARLRELARRRRGDRHGDRWQQVRLVFDGLGREGGRPELGLYGLGGLFDLDGNDEPIEGSAAVGGAAGLPRAALANEDLLAVVRSLSLFQDRDGDVRRMVDFRNLGAEELGSVYESLLELHPQHDPADNTFTLEAAAGNERKTTGSYYTPDALIQRLLDSTLDPVLDEAQQAADPAEALLNVTVCDPACGSGHFLVAAARRIAKRLAAVESEEDEPSPDVVRRALRRVVARCIHGVDVNPMAAELAKVALWLAAMEPGKPLSFLDANIRVGNSLLGTTPRLLAEGVPNAAFKALDGDDKQIVKNLLNQNKKDHSGHVDLFSSGVPLRNTELARETSRVTSAVPDELGQVREQRRRLENLEKRHRERDKLPADAWCAAFVQHKTSETWDRVVTQGKLQGLGEQEQNLLTSATAEEVRRLAAEYGFFHWHLEFPHIFRVPEREAPDNPETGWSGGFSCVLGNPPWDRVKLQEQEFFAPRDAEIAKAPNANQRKKLIDALAESSELADRKLHEEYLAACRRADGTSRLLRDSGRYPLTGRGDVNTYQVFAENDRTIISGRGRTGVVLPTGIATDATTQYFFRDLVESAGIASLYDFENRNKLFADVDSRFKFCLLTMSGRQVREEAADFAFFAHEVADLDKPDVRFALKPDEITLLNPNTGTLPVFRSRRDAEITLGIYKRVPVLVDENSPEGNPWGVSFSTMFHMSNDSHLFHTREELEADGWQLDGNVFVRGEDRMLPLYEAKMIHHYDHRWATYEGDSTRDVELAEKRDPEFAPMPRYWVARQEVDKRLAGKWDRGWLLGWRDICRSTDERTTIATSFPLRAVGNNLPIMLANQEDARTIACLQANLTAFALDYPARLKVGGTHLNYFVYQQLPVLPPSDYHEYSPWNQKTDVCSWVSRNVLELTYTAWDMAPFAADLGDEGPPFRWDEQRRELLRAELDAAYFHLYGVERDDVDYIMETFPIVRRKDEQAHGEFRTKRLILEIYDAMAEAIRTGEPYETVLDPPPGRGPRHPARAH